MGAARVRASSVVRVRATVESLIVVEFMECVGSACNEKCDGGVSGMKWDGMEWD
jgi:hypothetical protein